MTSSSIPSVTTPLDQLHTEIARLRAKDEIETVLKSYCRGVDRRQWSLLHEAFHDDAYDNHGQLAGPAADFIEHVKKRHETVLSSVHILSNVLIELDDDGRSARVESWCMSYQQVKPGTADPFADPDGISTRTTIASRYVDDFEYRESVGWRISYRQMAFEWSRRERDEDYLPPNQSWSMGKRDHTDPVFAPSRAQR